MILMGTGLAVAIFSVIKFVNHEMHKMNRELEEKKAELEKLTRGKRIAKHSDKNTP
jgi:Skp family chaperone for outer membrane proteins